LRQYEAIFIFRSSLKKEALQESVDQVGKEISSQGGTELETNELGKRTFARAFRKGGHDAGQLVRFIFTMDPAKVDAFRERFRHREDIVRLQIISVGEPKGDAEKTEPAAVAEEPPAVEEKANGIDESSVPDREPDQGS
jgi:ribosomal protein S6